MHYCKKIIPILLLLTVPLFVQCRGDKTEDENGNDTVDTNPPENGGNEETTFFSAPTEYGYSLEVVEVEGESYLALREISDEVDFLRAQGDGGELVAFNYWNGFVYFGEMVGGAISEGGVCSVEVLDMENGESHVLCVIETEAADRLYGQVIAAAGLVFIAAETVEEGETELSVTCFDIETGEDIAEWSGTGEGIEFISGCGTATPETVFFQVGDGHKYTLLTRERRVFVEIHDGLSGRFDAENGYWLFAREKITGDMFIEETDDGAIEIDRIFPEITGSSAVHGFPIFYSYRLSDGDVTPLFSAVTSDGNNPENIIDGDPATFWEAGEETGDWVRVDFGAPLRVTSMYLLPCNPVSENSEDFNRIKKARVELSSGHIREIEIPDELSLFELKLFDENQIPPEVTWVGVTVLEVYEGEKDGGTVIAEIAFDAR